MKFQELRNSTKSAGFHDWFKLDCSDDTLCMQSGAQRFFRVRDFIDAIRSQYLWSLLFFFRCDRDGKKQGKSDGGRSCLWTSQTAPQMPSLQTTAVHYPTVKGSSQETLAEMQKTILQPVCRFQAKRKTWKCQWACMFFVNWNDKCNMGKSSLQTAAY